jgi:hypothetical protein
MGQKGKGVERDYLGLELQAFTVYRSLITFYGNLLMNLMDWDSSQDSIS